MAFKKNPPKWKPTLGCPVYVPKFVEVTDSDGVVQSVLQSVESSMNDVKLPQPSAFGLDASLASGKNLDKTSVTLDPANPVDLESQAEQIMSNVKQEQTTD